MFPRLLSSLLAVQLDDELLAHRDLNIVAERQAPGDAFPFVRVGLEPRRHLAPAAAQVVVHARLHLRGRAQLHRLADPDDVRGDRDLPPVHLEVAVCDHLPALTARAPEPEPVHDVVEPELEQPQQILAGDPLLGLGPLEILAELALEHAVDPLRLLLLAQLHAERRQLAAAEAVLAGRVVAPLDRALVREAACSLEEALLPFTPAQAALRIAIPRHRRLLHPPPLRRAAPVVRGRRHVADRGDLQAHRLQRSDPRPAGRPPPGPFTKTSICFSPYSMALRAAISAAVCAAKGVLLREPLNPALPALDQETTLPVLSVSVTMVLLNVAWMCATPMRTSRRSRRLPPFFRGVGCFASSAMPYAPAFLGAGAAAGAAAGLFLTITPRRGPFRVRALVCVRCPRTGNPRRWRMPRYAPMSMRRLTFMDTSRRRSPSTLWSRSMSSRMRPTSSSVHALTRLFGSTLARPRILLAVARPRP